MQKKIARTLFHGALGLLAAQLAGAQTPTTFTFQGRLDENGRPLTGLYDMTFQVFASVDQNNPASEVKSLSAVGVTNGLFTTPLDLGSDPFNGDPRWLEISVKTNGSSAPYSPLQPRTALTSIPYAIYAYNARSVSSGAISNAQLAGDAVTASKIAPGQLVKSLNGLKDEISLTAGANIALTLTPSGNGIQISSSGSPFTLNGTADAYYNGGRVGIGTAEPYERLTVSGGGAWAGMRVLGSSTDALKYSLSDDAGHYGLLGLVSGSGGWLSGNRAGDLELVAPGNGRLKLGLGPVGTAPSATIMSLAGSRNYPQVGIGMDNPAWPIDVHATQAVGRFTSSGTVNGSVIELRNDTPSAEYLGAINFNDAAGSYSGQIGYHANGDMTFRAGGIERMRIHGNTVSVPVLTITGGADLAEPFQVSTKGIPKGALVVIDEENPGQLKLSQRPYDTRLAGIVSGANGVNPGISLHQEGVLEGGQNVALSGRVYALAEASNGAIKPGDLLTSSAVPGHCMKATDHAKAQGAIIGKAMSPLSEGAGMVLVLVSLQ